jgi:hypothetical protein
LIIANTCYRPVFFLQIKPFAQVNPKNLGDPRKMLFPKSHIAGSETVDLTCSGEDDRYTFLPSLRPFHHLVDDLIEIGDDEDIEDDDELADQVNDTVRQAAAQDPTLRQAMGAALAVAAAAAVPDGAAAAAAVPDEDSDMMDVIDNFDQVNVSRNVAPSITQEDDDVPLRNIRGGGKKAVIEVIITPPPPTNCYYYFINRMTLGADTLLLFGS